MAEQAPTHGATQASKPRRVLVLGATGTIGQATTRELVARGQEVVCFVRPQSRGTACIDGAALRFGEAIDPASLLRDGFRGERFDAVVDRGAHKVF